MMRAMGKSTHIKPGPEGSSSNPIPEYGGKFTLTLGNRGVRAITACLGNIKQLQKGYKMDLQPRFIPPGDYCKNQRASFLCHHRGVDSLKGNKDTRKKRFVY